MVNYHGPHKYTIWYTPTPNGGEVIKTSMGLAYLYAPFFFISHWYASTHAYDAGGYSPPYCFGIMMSNLFFTL